MYDKLIECIVEIGLEYDRLGVCLVNTGLVLIRLAMTRLVYVWYRLAWCDLSDVDLV